MRSLFIVWLLIIGVVATWTLAPASPPPQIPEVNRGKAFGSNEDIMVEGRRRQRRAAIRTLEQPWGGRCAGKDRDRFIGGLNEYYYHRQNQTERYPESFGKLGADYIAQQWATTDDKRIDRLTQEAYSKGYLKPAEFNAVAGKMIATVVKGERITVKACEG